MPMPTLTPEERLAALEKGKVARKKRADFLSQLKGGSHSVAAALEEACDDDILGRTKVLNFIKSFPGYGTMKAQKIMSECKIAETRRLHGLGVRQRQALIDTMAAHTAE